MIQKGKIIALYSIDLTMTNRAISSVPLSLMDFEPQMRQLH
jgi:hypothetical protein